MLSHKGYVVRVIFTAVILTSLAQISASITLRVTTAIGAGGGLNLFGMSSQKRKFDVLEFASHAGAAFSASMEVAEDLESIGHGHGVILLCASKLCRELNVIIEAAEEEKENFEDSKVVKSLFSYPLYPVSILFKVLSTKLVAVLLSLGALYAAFLEIFEDIKPGGHHGAIFLAINELIELLISSTTIRKGNMRQILENHFFRASLVSCAAIFALVETLSSTRKIGAHHGVLILSISKLFRVLGMMRSEFKEKEA